MKFDVCLHGALLIGGALKLIGGCKIDGIETFVWLEGEITVRVQRSLIYFITLHPIIQQNL